MRSPATNPYAPGAGSPPPELAGREDEISAFQLLLERVPNQLHEQSVVLVGQRGVGKTVLLNRFQDEAEAAGWAVLFEELEQNTELAPTIVRMTRRLLADLSRKHRASEALNRAWSVLKSFQVTFSPTGDVTVAANPEHGVADSGNLGADLTDVFLELGAVARQAGTGALLLLDELQYLNAREYAALIQALHRANQRRMPVVVAAAGLPLIPALSGATKSYAERLFRYPAIGSLAEPDAILALAKPAQAHGVSFERKAMQRMLDESERYPFFLQVFGRHVWNVSSSTTVTLVDVEHALPRVVAELDEGFYEARLGKTTDMERAYLLAMARLGPGPVKSGEVARTAGYGKTSDASVIRSKLINDALIYAPRRGELDYTVPKFGEFLLRRSGELEE